MRLWDLYNLVAILVEFDMDSLLLFTPHIKRCVRLVITQSVGSCRVKLIPEVWSCLSVVFYRRLSLLYWYYRRAFVSMREYRMSLVDVSYKRLDSRSSTCSVWRGPCTCSVFCDLCTFSVWSEPFSCTVGSDPDAWFGVGEVITIIYTNNYLFASYLYICIYINND